MEQLKLYQVGYDDFKQHFKFVSQSASIAFGDIKVMRNIETGQEVLVKPQETRSLEETEELLNTISEINIRLNGCPHFLQFLGFTEVPFEERDGESRKNSDEVNLIYLVFEYFPDTIETAWPHLIQSGKTPIEDLLKRLATSMTMCFATLELIGQAHTDISMQNILCYENSQDSEVYFKLVYSQYTTSAFRQVIDLQQHESNYFLAPEIQDKIENKMRSSSGLDPQKVDVYAFGKLLLLLSSHKNNSVDMSVKQSLHDEECVRGLLEIVRMGYSTEYYNLLCSMLEKENNKRPSFQTIGFTLENIDIQSQDNNMEEEKKKRSAKQNNTNQTNQAQSKINPNLQNQIKQLEKIPLANRAQEIRNDLFSKKKSNKSIPSTSNLDRSSSQNPQGMSRYSSNSTYFTPNRVSATKQQVVSPPGSLTRSKYLSPVSHSPYQRRMNNVPSQQFGYSSIVISNSKQSGLHSDAQSRYLSPSRYSTNSNGKSVKERFNKEYFDRVLQEIERKTILDEQGQLRSGMIRKDYQDGSVYFGEIATNEAGTELRQGSGIYYYKNFEGNILYSELIPNVSFGEMFAGDWHNNHFHGTGVYLFASGEKYEGELRDGQKTGEGTYYYSNGNEYKGEWDNDLKNGSGLFLYNTLGERYQGQFVNGQRNGEGTYHYRNGDMFNGMWVDGQKNGSGEVIFADQSHFEGEWKNDQPNGIGKMVYQNGDLYEGNFTGGCREGEGVYLHHRSNSRFQGTFKDDNPNGYGIFTYSNNDMYEGEVKSGQRHGRGIYTYQNNDKYEGEWKFDKKHGSGVFTFSDNSLYSGSWAAGQMKGQGSMDYGNGDTYRGEWLKDQKHGKGFYKWDSGNSYKGDWRNDKMNGKGVFVNMDGKTFSGTWSDNKLVAKI